MIDVLVSLLTGLLALAAAALIFVYVVYAAVWLGALAWVAWRTEKREDYESPFPWHRREEKQRRDVA